MADPRPVVNEDAEQVFETVYANGWTDGLPVVPSTPERVERMLDGRDPQQPHVALGTERREVTVGQVAVHAVLAGCHPSCFRAVLAALRGVAAFEEFEGPGMVFYRTPAAPMLVFGGREARELGVADSDEMLSLLARPNATIGRAVRLVLHFAIGREPGTTFDVQHGMPGRASMAFAERETDSPWEPYASQDDFPNGHVTVFPAFGTMPVNYHQVPQRDDELLTILEHCLDYVRGNRLGPWPDTSAVLVLSPKHARAFSAAGWTKTELEQRLTGAVNTPLEVELPSVREKLELINRGRGPDDPPVTMPMPSDPVRILVAGGRAGWHSLLVPTRGGCPPHTVPLSADDA